MKDEEFERRVKKMSKQQVEMIIEYEERREITDYSEEEVVGCLHTFEKDGWKLIETEDHYALIKIKQEERQ